MKPLYLQFCGINSFSEPAEINFANLLEFGIFGIFGDTGSGKSTVLDCIGFALYGNVARARSGSIADIINYKKDKASVCFEFEIVFEGKRRIFRVEREIKRKNAAQNVRVFEKTGESLLVLTDGVRESNAFLERVIGLEQKDFEKCIALPQGEFAQFVKAQRGDRLKLVSRLFDLEAYGAQLTKRVNRYCAERREKRQVLLARLEPYAEAGKEKTSSLEENIAVFTKREEAEKTAYAAALAREQALSALFEKAEEVRRVENRFAVLSEKRGEMERLSRELSALFGAQAVAKAARQVRLAERAAAEAEEAEQAAKEAFSAAERERDALAAFDEESAERELEKLAELRSAALLAADAEKRKARIEAETARAVKEFRTEAECYRDFDYASSRAALEEALGKLGSGDFLEYANAHGKAALFREEYATFASELGTLEAKYPVISEDARPLTEKYLALSQGESGNYTALRASFEAREKERKRLTDALAALETARGKYEVHCQRLQHLSETVRRLKEEAKSCDSVRLPFPPEEIEEKYRRCRREKKEREERQSKARQAYTVAYASLAAEREKAAAAKKALALARERLAAELKEGNFSSAAEAESLCEKYGDAEAARARLKAFESEFSAVAARRAELAGTDVSEATEENLALARAACTKGQEAVKECAAQLALTKEELARNERALAEKEQIEAEYAANERECAVYDKLQSLIENNRFMEFVAEEYLQTVASHASERLLSLTDGRYFLTYKGGFFVGDNFNGGAERGVYTLSGGETFLVSLSLALALGAEICAKSLRPIEFFFLDEGFGTLDERLVDTVMDSLEKLRGENFSIGIISHVGELKHRIDRKLTVKKATEKRGSQITVE